MADRPILFSGPMVRALLAGTKTQTRRVLNPQPSLAADERIDRTPPRDIPRDADIEHAATARSYAEIGLKGKLRPGMFLPRWASRLTLQVTEVRVQRLQEISHDDAVAEGVGIFPHSMSAQKRYRELWDSLNAARGYGWDANPWVVAVSFTVHRGNIDQMAEVA